MNISAYKCGRQRGSALIIALLIVSVVSLMSVRFAESFIQQIDQAELTQHARLTAAYVQGAEALAAQFLLQDRLQQDVENERVDHLQEMWAQPVPILPTDNGWLQISLSDAQSRFNLNNLSAKADNSDNQGAPATHRLSPAQKQFVRLLQSFEDYPVSEADAVMMTEALIDWMDEDDLVTGQGGAESLFYSTSDSSLQAANQLLSDVSELYLVRHFTPELVERLRPWVTVLPVPGPMNLNTAPARLLATINQFDVLQPLPVTTLQSLLEVRTQRPFLSVSEFFEHPEMLDAERSSGSSDFALYSVGSRWFVLDSALRVNDMDTRWRSLIFRDEQGAKVWSGSKVY